MGEKSSVLRGKTLLQRCPSFRSDHHFAVAMSGLRIAGIVLGSIVIAGLLISVSAGDGPLLTFCILADRA
jgi:hypothetical protein